MTNDEDGPVSNEMVQKAQLKKMVAICNEMKEMKRNDPDGLSECLGVIGRTNPALWRSSGLD